MKTRRVVFGFIALCCASIVDCRACTSALVGALRSSMGHALLWKHRDTGSPYNHLMRHEATDSTFEFIALHNGGDVDGRESWIGMNKAGFAVMNTASYNLMPDTASYKDREGFVMTAALKSCRSLGDFCRLLDSMPRPLGIQANFGVMDAEGGQAFIEADDYGYTLYNVARDSVMVRTNYSHSGGEEGRLGFARERTAVRLIDNGAPITRELLTDTLSRRFIDPMTGKDIATQGIATLLDNGNFIPRYISTASIVIEAVPSPQRDGSNYVMWAVIGYPPFAEVNKVTFDSVPLAVMRAHGGMTPSEHKSHKLKKRIYTGRKQGKHRVIDMNAYRRLMDEDIIEKL